MLEVILYFACTLILILVGLILVLLKLEAIGGSMIAAGLAGSVMYWATYIQRKQATEEKNLLEKMRRFGIVDILPRRLTKEETDALLENKAKRSLDVLGLSLVMFSGDAEDGHLQRIAERARVRLLMVHPNSPYCELRDYEESLLPGTTRNEVIKLTKFVQHLNSPNIEIRWHRSTPATFVEIVDNEEMVVSPYLLGRQRRNTYSLRIRKGALFDYYRVHFDKVWDDPELSCEPNIEAGAKEA